MAKHKLNPEAGELWYHPLTFNMYYIHSTTDDGWVRYRISYPGGVRDTGALWTQPTLDFVKNYKRQENTSNE